MPDGTSPARLRAVHNHKPISAMSNQNIRPARKLGANRNEPARKQHRTDANFAQSRDIREDRGERIVKTAPPRRTVIPPNRGR